MRHSALRSLCTGALLVTLASTPAPAAGESNGVGGARAERTLRVVLLPSAAAEWRARAWGQLSDLPVVLHSAQPGRYERDDSVLPRVAEAHSADVIVRLVIEPEVGSGPGAHGDRSARIVIYESREQRFHTRVIGAAWASLEDGERSAALEVAALTLRSVLRSVLEHAETPPAPEAPRAWGLRAGAGASWQLDGQTQRGALSLGGEVGIAWRAWSFSFGGQWGLDADIATREATLRLMRHALFLEVRHQLLQLEIVELGVLARGGLAITRRETLALSERVVQFPAITQTSAVVGAGGVASVRLWPEHALELSLIASGYTAPARHLIRDAGRQQESAYPLWKLQPAAALAWAVTF